MHPQWAARILTGAAAIISNVHQARGCPSLRSLMDRAGLSTAYATVKPDRRNRVVRKTRLLQAKHGASPAAGEVPQCDPSSFAGRLPSSPLVSKSIRVWSELSI